MATTSAVSATSAAPRSTGAMSGVPEVSDAPASLMIKESAYGGVHAPQNNTTPRARAKRIEDLAAKAKTLRRCGFIGAGVAVMLSSVFFLLGIFAMMGTVYFIEIPDVRKIKKN